MNTTCRRRALGVMLLPLLIGLSAMRTGDTTPATVPFTDAISGIFQILDSIPVVAIGDLHLAAEEGEFYQRLIRDPRFPSKVNDLILEGGNETYQRVADRYVNGETVPLDSVRMMWENSTQGSLITSSAPMYTSMYDAVRAINSTLPESRRVRILLGDPAVEWNTITREQLWEVHKLRGDRMRELARDSVVRKGRRAIIIAGFTHIGRRPMPGSSSRADTKWGDLSNKVFVIRPHDGFGRKAAAYEPAMDSLPRYSLIRTRGTFVGDLELDEVDDATPSSSSVDTIDVPPVGMNSSNKGLKVRDVADGYLYVAPFRSLTISLPDVDRVRKDPARLKELTRRSCMMFGKPVDTLRLYRVPSSRLYFPSGQRQSAINYVGPSPTPEALPPLTRVSPACM